MTSEAPASTNTADLSDTDVERFMSSLSNWGRWGDDDRLGTLNLITDAVRKAAAQEIRSATPSRCPETSIRIRPTSSDRESPWYSAL